MKKLQYRYQDNATIRLADPTQDGKKIVGRAIVYGTLSRDLGGFQERIAPGAFKDSISQGLVCALVNHDTSQPLGDMQAKTLRLVDSSAGLDIEIDTPDTSYARDAVAIMKQRGGTGTGMSFGFCPTTTNWTKENDTNISEVIAGELGEVSVLTGMPPAYAETSCAVRSLMDQGEIDQVERYGIDIDKVAKLFVAIKNGLPLDSNEQDALENALRCFKKIKRPALSEAIERASKLQLI